MIDTILVRVSEPKYLDHFDKIVAFLEEETDFVIMPVDHTELRLSDFDVRGFQPVSLDRRLALKLQTPYLQIRRVFDLMGNVMQRQKHEMLWNEALDPNVQKIIIDTDMASGNTIELAQRLLQTPLYSVPILSLIHI